MGHAGSPFLLNVPLAFLDRVCSCFGGALVELGGGEPMPFLLTHNVTADACVKCYGGTSLVLGILRPSVHLSTTLRLGERGL